MNRIDWIALCAIFFAAAARSEEGNLICPASVSLSSGVVAADKTPRGSQTLISKSPIYLTGVSIFDGPPEQGAALIPVSEQSQSNNNDSSVSRGSAILWNFEENYPQGIYISCDYGKGIVRVFSKIAVAPHACTANVQHLKLHDELKANFSCK